MSDMLDYSVAMLSAISDFLSSPPMFYLLGFIILAITVKVLINIMPWR